MPGYKDWIDAIDIKVDYFSAFMKAWINKAESCCFIVISSGSICRNQSVCERL